MHTHLWTLVRAPGRNGRREGPHHLLLTCWDYDPLLFARRIGRRAAALVVVSAGIGYLGRVDCSSRFIPLGDATVHRGLSAGGEDTGALGDPQVMYCHSGPGAESV